MTNFAWGDVLDEAEVDPEATEGAGLDSHVVHADKTTTDVRGRELGEVNRDDEGGDSDSEAAEEAAAHHEALGAVGKGLHESRTDEAAWV